MVSVTPAGGTSIPKGLRLSALWLLILAALAPASEQESHSTGVSLADHDFSEEFYRSRGIDPSKIHERLGEKEALAVPDRSPDPSRRALRALEWRGGYDAAGSPLFFHRFGSLERDAYLETPAGDQARQIGETFRVYTFPRRQSLGRRLLVQDRQDPVFDPTAGAGSENPLGLWKAFTVVFTEEVFRSRKGLAALEEIQIRNGTDRDGTPILSHRSEILLLEREGFVRVAPASGEGPGVGLWVLWPIHPYVPGERIPRDGFPALVMRDEGSAVEPALEQAFFCWSQSGQFGMSRMPRLPPFIQPLQIPPVLEPRESVDPAPEGARLQGYAEAPPVDIFELHERAFWHRFHPDLPASLLWGYEGSFPGPTIRVRRGRPFLLRVWNDLPPGESGGVGQPRTVCRPELFPLPAESAGYPEDHYPPGHFKDHYCSSLRGTSEGVPTPTMGRYRDGRLGFSAQNLYRGLGGFLIARDDADSGDEKDPAPGALRLPGGAYDVPLLLADKSFDESFDHALTWDPFGMSVCSGGYVTVNGAIQPYFRVARRKYRFRVWNAGPSRAYELALSNGAPLHLLAVDGYFLEAPVASPTLPLPGDERRDIVIDFSTAKIGSKIYLEDHSDPGRSLPGAVPGVPRKPFRILQFQVDRDAPDPSLLPKRLPSGAADAPAPDLPVRAFTFSDVRGVWMVNGKGFDLERADAVVRPGAREIWILKNDSADLSHSIRLPVEGRILPSPGDPSPRTSDSGFRLGADLGPGQEVRLLLQFPPWTGKYVMTCGDLVREDRGMLFRWDVSR